MMPTAMALVFIARCVGPAYRFQVSVGVFNDFRIALIQFGQVYPILINEQLLNKASMGTPVAVVDCQVPADVDIVAVR